MPNNLNCLEVFILLITNKANLINVICFNDYSVCAIENVYLIISSGWEPYDYIRFTQKVNRLWKYLKIIWLFFFGDYLTKSYIKINVCGFTIIITNSKLFSLLFDNNNLNSVDLEKSMILPEVSLF